MSYALLRRALFALDAETAHGVSLWALARCNRGPLGAWMRRRVAALPVRVMGIDFPNPIGLCAGLDKDARCVHGLSNLGFGFIEIGTVTPKPQPGNPKPRLFRLPQQQALINRMGFNNEGVEALCQRLRAAQFGGVLGINIGKNRDTPLERAGADYQYGLERVYPYASYVAVNVSSPNTPGLRSLQSAVSLAALLGELKQAQQRLAQQHQRYVPLALKIAPDLSAEEIVDIATAVRASGFDAVIATNTSSARAGLAELPLAREAGGLSGAPIASLAVETVRQLRVALGEAVPIIAAGGTGSGADARAKIAAGAQLVQLYTGLIYRGPGLIGECVEALRPTYGTASDRADAAPSPRQP